MEVDYLIHLTNVRPIRSATINRFVLRSDKQSRVVIYAKIMRKFIYTQ